MMAAADSGDWQRPRLSVKVEVVECEDEDTDFTKLEHNYFKVANDDNVTSKHAQHEVFQGSDLKKEPLDDGGVERGFKDLGEDASIDATLQVYDKINIHEVTVKVEDDTAYDSDPEMQMVIDEEALEFSKLKCSNPAEAADLAPADEAEDNNDHFVNMAFGQHCGVFTCELCMRFYSTYSSFVAHVRFTHLHSKLGFSKRSSEKAGGAFVAYLNEKYYCKTCTCEFPAERDLTAHANRSSFECASCDVAFESCRMLLDHYFSDKCTATTCECGQKWASCYLLSWHAASCRGNPQEPSYKCRLCWMVFANNRSLYAHLKRVHLGEECALDETSDACGTSQHMSTELRYRCRICGSNFETIQQRSSHRRPSSVFLCDACSLGFVDVCSMRSHRCQPRKILPPQCSLCLMMFIERAHMIQHMTTCHLRVSDGGRGNEHTVSAVSARSEGPVAALAAGGMSPAIRVILQVVQPAPSDEQALAKEKRPRTPPAPPAGALFPATAESGGATASPERLDELPAGSSGAASGGRAALDREGSGGQGALDREVKEEPPEYDEDMLEVLQDLRSREEVVIVDAAKVKTEQFTDSIDEFIAGTREVAPPRAFADACDRCGDPKRTGPHVCPTERIYHCKFCKETSRSFAVYLLHLRRHGYGPDECPACGDRLPAPEYFRTHVISHVLQDYNSRVNLLRRDSTDAATCGLCKEEVASAEILAHWEAHVLTGDWYDGAAELGARPPARAPRKQEMYPSADVDEWDPSRPGKRVAHYESGFMGQLNRPSILKTVQYLLTKKKLKQCHLCSKPFCRTSDFKRHLIEHLVGDIYRRKNFDGVYRCAVCAEKLRELYAFKKHLRAHAGLALYECAQCGKCFSDSSNFGKHKKVHGHPYMECDLCARRFTSRVMLVKHMQYHARTVPLACPDCPRLFYFPSMLKRHARGHGKPAGEVARPAVRRDAHPCPSCRATFPSMRYMWNHQWLSHGVRKYEADCPHCDSGFRNFMHLRKHMMDQHQATIFKLPRKRTSAGPRESRPGEAAGARPRVRDVVDLPYRRGRSGSNDYD